ncbi:MAG: InlB B-repeat-containing protein [Erysipelotrichales bacterium]|nr:InlB B-repeat-containing protein [Erysipelotrichales bacterium]
MKKCKIGMLIVSVILSVAVLIGCQGGTTTKEPIPNEYTITYVLNGGTNHENNPTTFTESNLPLTIQAASRDGYEFKGWFTNANFTGGIVTQITQVGNVRLYAQWQPLVKTYTISYSLNGGTNHAANPTTFTESALPLTLNPATKAGHNFLGWFTNANFTGAAITQITETGNITLYAQFEAIEYTISYELNGGINHENNPSSFVITALPVQLYPASKTGYTFMGWFLNPELEGTPITELRDIARDVKLYASFEMPIAITYHLDGGTNHADNPEVLYQSQLPFTLLNPTRNGYEFLGWFRTADFQDEAVTVLRADDKGFELFAQWAEIVDYTITYHLDGGINHAKNPEIYNRTMLPLVLEMPTKEGYIFLGWFNNPEFTGELIQSLQKGQTGDLNLYAKWEAEPTFDVNFELNGGVFGFLSPEDLFTEFLTDLHGFLTNRNFPGLTPDLKTFMHGEGNTSGFLGTFTNGTNQVLGPVMQVLFVTGNRDFNPSLGNAEAFFIYHPTYRERWLPFFDQLDLYMRAVNATQSLWTDSFAAPIRIMDWILNIRAAHPNTNFMPAGPEIPETFRTKHFPFTIPVPRRLGYEFDGWFTSSDFSGEAVTILTEAKDISLYAKWVPIPDVYTITYVLNGGTNHANNPYILHANDLPIKIYPAEKVGYLFIGWFDNPDFTGAAIEEITERGSLILYANFESQALHTITYELNGGINHANNPSTFFGSDLPIQLQPATKVGYTFLGWFDNPDFTGVAIKEITQAGDITLYASFEIEREYQITYVLNDGQNSSNNPNTFVGSKLPIQLYPAEKAGYIFLGWFTTSDFSGEAINSITATGDITLYASFKVIPSDHITYVLNGGTWNHHTMNQLMTDFLTDLHTFMRANGHTVIADLQIFIHGAAEANEFRGTWQTGGLTGVIGGLHADVANALWIGALRDGTDQTRFFYNDEMRAKWLGFGDKLEAFTRAVNSDQGFWGNAWLAGVRFPQFVVNHFKTQWQAVDSYNFFPEMSNLNPIVLEGGVTSLQTPWHKEYTFIGWYTTADFQEGTKMTSIPAGSTNVTLFARWA